MENLRPDRVVIAASGIESHQELLDLVGQKLGGIPKPAAPFQRAESVYQGGEVRSLNDNDDTQISLVFQGAHYKSEDFYALKVAEVVLGQSRLGAWAGKDVAVDRAVALQSNFSDSGLFGLQAAVASDAAQRGLDGMVNVIKGMNQVNKAELNQAKAVLMNSLLTHLDRSADRLEEAAKNVNIFNQV